MKSLTMFLLAIGIVFAPMAGFAHEHEMGMDKGMMMHGMMMKMMERTVVATSDGGVVVVTGDKMVKYDRNLKVIKEVDLPNGMCGMKEMMGNMKSKCKECTMMNKEHAEKPEAKAPEAPAVNHH